jgi:hypothetical protein
MRNRSLLLWPLIVLALFVLGIVIRQATTPTPRRVTVVDQLCPGFTVDASHAILCLQYTDGDSLVWNTQETNAHRNRIVQLLWFVEQGRLVRADSL